MKWRWLIGVPLVLAGGTCGAVMSLAHVEATDEYNDHRARLGEAMKKHDDAFRADLRTVSSLSFLDGARATSTSGKDAGPFFAEKVLTKPLIDEPLGRKLTAVPVGKFPAGALDIDVSAVDTSWMKELASFEHWEIVDPPPVHFHNVDFNPAVRPMFAAVARARLLQGLRAGDVKTAARDVEQLARLVASTEVWVVATGAPHLMELVRATFEHARAEGLDVDGWDPPDRKEVAAARRSLRGYVASLDFHVDPAWHRDLLTSPELATWRCVALNETAVTYLEIEPVSGDRYRDAHDWIANALALTKNTCRLSLVRQAWDNEEQNVLVVGSDAMCDPINDPGGCIAASIASSFPGIRDLPIESFTTSAPALFDGYEARRE
jgi:hypothetical protein